MTTVPQYHNMSDGRQKIALANLVGPQEGAGYVYIATRMYDAVNDTVTDEVLSFKGVSAARCGINEFRCVEWRDLPTLDVKTKRLIGKNKEKYCTLLSIRAYYLGRVHDTGESNDSKSIIVVYDEESFDLEYPVEYVMYHVLGYTFIDVNGDKVYLTVQQLRKSDILQHTHSMERAARTGGLYYWLRNKSAQKASCVTPLLERAEEDIVVEDSEIEELEVYKALTGSWYTISPSGVLHVDRAALEAAQLEVIEVPNGVHCILAEAFLGISHVKRIKLPETLYEIGCDAFKKMPDLEEVNIPSQVKVLDGILDGCHKLKRLDLSGVETLCTRGDVSVDYLVLPDVLPKVEGYGSITVGVLEFRNVQGAKRRVLKAQSTTSGSGLMSAFTVYAKKIITNGPVVLGAYSACIGCADTSAFESNIVGIAPDCTFYKADSAEAVRSWLLGSSAEFIYKQRWLNDYSLTEDAYAANKLRVVYVWKELDIKLPKSVEIMQGRLSKPMCHAEYPNVVYASYGLYRWHMFNEVSSIVTKLPSLRWILPEGKTLTEVQIKRLEKELTPMLPELCKATQEKLKLDLTKAENLVTCKEGLLTGTFVNDVEFLFRVYGMIYVGDYSEVLKGK